MHKCQVAQKKEIRGSSRGNEKMENGRQRVLGRCKIAEALPDIQLKGFKTAAYRSTTGAFSASSLFSHQDIDASLTKTTDTFCAGIRLPEERNTLACSAVNLRVLGRIAWRGVRQAPRFDVEVIAALTALYRWEWVRRFGIVGRRRERLLEWRSLVTSEGILRKGRQ